MNKTTLQIETDLVKKVKEVAKEVNPHRNINSFADSAREAFIFYIKYHERELNHEKTGEILNDVRT